MLQIAKNKFIGGITFLFASSIIFSFTFNGTNTHFLYISQLILILCVFLLIYSQHEYFYIVLTPLSLSITLFWIWLGVSIIWAKVTYLSIIGFWWLGAFPLTFWIFSISNKERLLWNMSAMVATILAILLCAMALYQFFFLNEQPRSLFLYRNLLGAFLSLLAFLIIGLILKLSSEDKSNNHFEAGLQLTLFLFIFVLGIIKSRGVLLSFLVGLLLMIITCLHIDVDRKILLRILSLVGLGLLISIVVTQGENLHRLATLSSPYEAGKDRIGIWLATSNMIKHNPWLGTGFGTFWLVYPPFRPPSDNSGGYFAHNDYLQLWVEGGSPALLLILMVMASTTFIFIRAFHNLEKNKKIEMVSLLAGLTALALHTFFDFNFYSVPTMMLTGLFLGRINNLATMVHPYPAFKLSPARYFHKSIYAACIFLLFLLLIIHFTSIEVSNWFYKRAMFNVYQMKLSDAQKDFMKSKNIWIYYDQPYYSHANMLQIALETFKYNETSQRAIFLYAEKLLDEAENLNPFRVITYCVRGRLYQHNFKFLGPFGKEKIIEAYKKAIKVDPLYYPARVSLAKFLINQGRKEESLAVLQKGISYQYEDQKEVKEYFTLTRKLQEELQTIKN